ncbi:NlpC/P60 family protein [Streptomyces sp. NPDC052000]|uniref:C40 family peptidase n=1 Tax=Streptomyces sp. NPDC052000 TaxID=3155676 RepID=UPI00344EAF17
MSGRVRSVCAAAAVATALVTMAPAPPAGAAPQPPGESSAALPEQPSLASPASLLTRLRTLYQQAEEATETYKSTDVELKRRQAEEKQLAGSLATARSALARSRGAAGQLARAQYQGGRSELSSYMRLLLARDPQSALEQRQVLDRAARDRQAAVARLARGERQAAELAQASRRALDEQEALARRQQQAKDDVELRLRQVEKLLADLSPDQLSELARLERQGTATAQRNLLASGALSGTRAPSSEGDRALAYAVDQIGKPYVWGAEGPESYDCSGLTSQAWAHAGRSIPRTSQEQWAELPRVPLNSLRPGDLVIYFPKATHVAMYLGDGLVVQAPRPGTRVKVSPIAANPLLGAVRPDPAAAPLSSYHPPKLPEGATEGVDTGYSAGSGPKEDYAPATSAR